MTDVKVLVVSPEVDLVELGEHMVNGGPQPAGSHYESFEEFTARGRVKDCDCGLIECVCAQVRPHKPTCRYRVSMTCAVPISCDHGFETCPECDRCDCGLEEK